MAVALLISLGPSSAVLGQQTDGPVGLSQDTVRVENEFKLSVPDDLLEPVRDFLRQRYGTGDTSILPEIGAGLTATISDEYFVDEYFDAPDLPLLGIESGVRSRQRWNLADPISDRKHGRRLLQLKLARPSDDNTLNRTEVKFDVEPQQRVRSDLDRYPVLRLIDHEDRPVLIRTLGDLGLDAKRMRPSITIDQRRWRVYLSRDGAAFSTLTLDEVSSAWLLWNVAFVELEIELNEIAYTDATPEERQAMERVSHLMADDIRAHFPAIVQDQTPKYNKVFDAFSSRIPAFRTAVLYEGAIGLSAILALVVMLALVARVAMRRAGWSLSEAFRPPRRQGETAV